MTRREEIRDLQKRLKELFDGCQHPVLVLEHPYSWAIELRCKECGCIVNGIAGCVDDLPDPAAYFRPSYPDSIIEHDPQARPSSPPEN